jgi:hypothetical protein
MEKIGARAPALNASVLGRPFQQHPIERSRERGARCRREADRLPSIIASDVEARLYGTFALCTDGAWVKIADDRTVRDYPNVAWVPGAPDSQGVA